MTQVKLTESQMESVECHHVDQAQEVTYSDQVCPECVKLGDSWVHLRICLVCGHVACCNSSKNKHAAAHFKATGHPLIKTIQAGEDWAWCYVDEVYLE
ncbi:MAG: UBP-type zinc finger domain-containing protein [Bacillota bacterium]